MAPFKRRRRSSMFFGASSKSVPQPTWAQCKIGGRCNQVQPLSLQIFPRTPRLQTLEPHVPVTSGVVFFGQTWQSLSRRTHYSRHCTLESMGHRSRKRNNGFFPSLPPSVPGFLLSFLPSFLSPKTVTLRLLSSPPPTVVTCSPLRHCYHRSLSSHHRSPGTCGAAAAREPEGGGFRCYLYSHAIGTRILLKIDSKLKCSWSCSALSSKLLVLQGRGVVPILSKRCLRSFLLLGHPQSCTKWSCRLATWS